MRRWLLLFGLLVLGLGAALLFDLRAADNNPVVIMETSMGTIKIELNQDKAPITVKNFLEYVDKKHYDGTIFHRVMSDFMIQGGGMEPGMKEKRTGTPIKNEAGNGLSNARGAIAMARTQALDSATAQFYINVVDNNADGQKKGTGKTDLDRGRYCVFGKVTEGMDVVDKIRRVETHTVGIHDDVPVKDVLIKSVRREEKK